MNHYLECTEKKKLPVDSKGRTINPILYKHLEKLYKENSIRQKGRTWKMSKLEERIYRKAEKDVCVKDEVIIGYALR